MVAADRVGRAVHPPKTCIREIGGAEAARRISSILRPQFDVVRVVAARLPEGFPMLISVETGVQSFRVEQKYNAAKPSSAGKRRLSPT
jgi:hypothetical protein